MTTHPRFLLTRLAGLLLSLALYAAVFGLPLSDDPSAADPPAPAAPRSLAAGPEGQSSPADDRTQQLQELIDNPDLRSLDRWSGVTEWHISRPIVVDLDRVGPFSLRGWGWLRIVMDGPGPALRIIGTHQGTADPQSVQPNVWEKQRMPAIDGLEIVGNHPEACGIELTGTMQAVISRVNIRRCLHAIHLTRRNRNVLISDSHLYENRGCGVLLDDVDLHQINITGCHISYNAGGGVVSRKGNVRNLHITGCDIESNMAETTDPTANVLIDCRESKYGTAEVAITGCTIQHNSRGPDSANIRILGRSEPTADQPIVREGNITLTGNILSDVQVNVHLQDCRGVTLTGNTFWMGYQHNLLVEDCTHIILGPNNLDRNPRYAYGTSLETKNAVLFRNCSDCTLTGLHVSHVWRAEAGVALENCRWMNIAGCTILDCDGPALLLTKCEHCRLSGLMIRDQRRSAEEVVAVQLVDCRDVRIADDGLIHGEIEGAPAP
jgi:hypothetical protein